MHEDEVVNILTGAKALLMHDHFVLESGKHSSEYLDPKALYLHTVETSILCEEIALRFSNNGIQAVVGAGPGGAILSQWTAEYLSRKSGYERRIPSLYADKERRGFSLHRGYRPLVKNKNLLVVEDILGSGETVRGIMEAVRAAGGHVFGLGVIMNQCGLDRMELEVTKFEALTTWPFSGVWNSRECPLCKAGVPINTEFGKGHFRLTQAAWKS